MVASRPQATDAEPQVSRWLADRARPFADAPLQKRSSKQFISLSQGTPDLPTPRHAIEAVEEYLRDGTVYYTFHDGMPELREAIARKLARENGLQLRPRVGDHRHRRCAGGDVRCPLQHPQPRR